MSRRGFLATGRVWALGGAALGASAAGMSGAPDYDFAWRTIGAPGNAPYQGDWMSQTNGRGRVDYTYRISALEITSAQWMEFVNAYAGALGDPYGFKFVSYWGAEQDFSYSGPGRRYKLRADLPQASMNPVFGISWRKAAMYANWLHNQKAPTLAAIANGAYDISTFGTDPLTGALTDQAAHNPGAKFWIPTLDEWIKAAHYDPNRHGPGQGGYWEYSHTSDTAPTSGAPGQGQTSAGYIINSYEEYFIPLGAYPEVRSPWGLLDVSGGAWEWTEDWLYLEHTTSRIVEGARAGQTFEFLDLVSRRASESPQFHGGYESFRIASSIPAPTTLMVIWGASITLAHTLKRRT